MFSDIQLGENSLGQALEEKWRSGSHQQHKIFLDVLFLGPFCEQWDVLHGTLRSQTLAEQSKQQEPKKKMDLRILQQLCQSPQV